MTKYTIKPTGQFKKDFKLAQKRHLDTDLLKEIINKLANGQPLEEKHKAPHYPAIGPVIASATFYRTGSSSTALKTMY